MLVTFFSLFFFFSFFPAHTPHTPHTTPTTDTHHPAPDRYSSQVKKWKKRNKDENEQEDTKEVGVGMEEVHSLPSAKVQSDFVGQVHLGKPETIQ